jgi:hypothetical protein
MPRPTRPYKSNKTIKKRLAASATSRHHGPRRAPSRHASGPSRRRHHARGRRRATPPRATTRPPRKEAAVAVVLPYCASGPPRHPTARPACRVAAAVPLPRGPTSACRSSALLCGARAGPSLRMPHPCSAGTALACPALRIPLAPQLASLGTTRCARHSPACAAARRALPPGVRCRLPSSHPTRAARVLARRGLPRHTDRCTPSRWSALHPPPPPRVEPPPQPTVPARAASCSAHRSPRPCAPPSSMLDAARHVRHSSLSSRRVRATSLDPPLLSAEAPRHRLYTATAYTMAPLAPPASHGRKSTSLLCAATVCAAALQK